MLQYRPARNSRRFSRLFREKPEWNGVRPIREANSAWANASYCHAPILTTDEDGMASYYTEDPQNLKVEILNLPAGYTSNADEITGRNL